MFKDAKLVNSEARIENTSKCNANCTICPREKMTRPKVTMPMDHFKSLVDQCKDLGAKTISIFGYGEPLIDTKLEDKIQYCTDLGLETFVTTNVDLLDHDRAYSILDTGLTHIRFSIHGLFSRQYEETHRGTKFTEVIRNAFNFIILNDEQYGHACKISASMIPTHGEKIQDIVDFWGDNVDWLEIWKPHNWAGGRDYRSRTKRRKATCGRPFSGPIQIQADGMMTVCCFDFNGKLKIGDTYEGTIEDILKGTFLHSIKITHLGEVALPATCAYCDQLNIGDQPLLYSSRDPECKIGKTSSTKFDLCENL